MDRLRGQFRHDRRCHDQDADSQRCCDDCTLSISIAPIGRRTRSITDHDVLDRFRSMGVLDSREGLGDASAEYPESTQPHIADRNLAALIAEGASPGLDYFGEPVVAILDSMHVTSVGFHIRGPRRSSSRAGRPTHRRRSAVMRLRVPAGAREPPGARNPTTMCAHASDALRARVVARLSCSQRRRTGRRGARGSYR